MFVYPYALMTVAPWTVSEKWVKMGDFFTDSRRFSCRLVLPKRFFQKYFEKKTFGNILAGPLFRIVRTCRNPPATMIGMKNAIISGVEQDMVTSTAAVFARQNRASLIWAGIRRSNTSTSEEKRFTILQNA